MRAMMVPMSAAGGGKPRPARADRPEFLPLERYALIGECGTAALVSDEGSIDWLCLPRFDSDPFFGRLLDPDGGHFSVRPTEPFTSSRQYIPDSAVVAITFTTASGRATVYDFFAARTFEEKRRHLWPLRYLVRRIEGEEGTLEFDVEIAPRDSFKQRSYNLTARGARLYVTRHGWAVFVEASAPFTVRGDVGHTRVKVSAGDRAYVTLSEARGAIGVLPPTGGFAEAVFEETIRYWKDWSEKELVGGRAPASVRRSALTLKLLTFAPSGGVVAAPTTSLPETIGGERNWDYRFVWVRDASRMIVALFDLGYHDEAHAYMYWISNAIHLSRPDILTMYGVHGEHRFKEEDIQGLRGYMDSRPVRRGNAALEQMQLDNWGQLIDAAFVFAERSGEMDSDMWSVIRSLVQFVAKNWQRPDHGIWEVRGRPRNYVHSKVMCWVALDRGIRLVRHHRFKGPVEEWERARDDIRAAVLEEGYDSERGTFKRTFEDDVIDAALLEIPIVRFLPGDDERVVRTIDRIREELGRGDLLYRYRTADELEGNEGCFLACSFWLVQALALAGKYDEACQMFDRLCERRNDVGLLPEEIDPDSGRFLGNFPQGFSHIALVNAAATLRRMEDDQPSGR
jgi:GH15 family glucan-1,4-alpha-glucosidase